MFTSLSYQGVGEADLDGVRIINKAYAGQTYQLSGDLAEKYPNGVEFTEEGFPDFSPYSTKTVTVDNLVGDAYYDFIKANEAAGYDSTPEGYTWHHVEDGKTMELVPSDLHGAVRHTGGAALIRKGIRP
ncbi:HNH endonuclease [Clostridium saccharobutylicum]|uniref:HNH endonuclease n=1 Tax=Clostridium saccharobutylicum TaxID=169679 RepID=UPI0009850307